MTHFIYTHNVLFWWTQVKYNVSLFRLLWERGSRWFSDKIFMTNCKKSWVSFTSKTPLTHTQRKMDSNTEGNEVKMKNNNESKLGTTCTRICSVRIGFLTLFFFKRFFCSFFHFFGFSSVFWFYFFLFLFSITCKIPLTLTQRKIESKWNIYKRKSSQKWLKTRKYIDMNV